MGLDESVTNHALSILWQVSYLFFFLNDKNEAKSAAGLNFQVCKENILWILIKAQTEKQRIY